MTTSYRVRAQSEKEGGVQKDLLVKNTVDSAEINVNTTIGKRRYFEI
jgi:hypothetical protein